MSFQMIPKIGVVEGLKQFGKDALRSFPQAYGRTREGITGFLTGDNPIDSVSQAYGGLVQNRDYDPAEIGFVRGMQPGQRGYGTATAAADALVAPETYLIGAGGPALSQGLRQTPRIGKFLAGVTEPVLKADSFGKRSLGEVALATGAIQGSSFLNEVAQKYTDNPYLHLAASGTGLLVGGGAGIAGVKAVSNASDVALPVLRSIFDPDEIRYAFDQLVKDRFFRSPDSDFTLSKRNALEADLTEVNHNYKAFNNQSELLRGRIDSAQNIFTPPEQLQFHSHPEKGSMFGGDLIDYQNSYDTAHRIVTSNDPILKTAYDSALNIMRVLDEIGTPYGGNISDGIDAESLLLLLDDNSKRSWAFANPADFTSFENSIQDNKLYNEAVRDVFNLADDVAENTGYKKEDFGDRYSPAFPNPFLRWTDHSRSGISMNLGTLHHDQHMNKFVDDLILSMYLGNKDTITTTGLMFHGRPAGFYKFYNKAQLASGSPIQPDIESVNLLLPTELKKMVGRPLSEDPLMETIEARPYDRKFIDRQERHSDIEELRQEGTGRLMRDYQLNKGKMPDDEFAAERYYDTGQWPSREAQYKQTLAEMEETQLQQLTNILDQHKNHWDQPENFAKLSSLNMVDDLRNIYKGIVKIEYDNTQRMLTEGYGFKPDDTITLFRGIDSRDQRMTPEIIDRVNDDLLGATLTGRQAEDAAAFYDEVTHQNGRLLQDMYARLRWNPQYANWGKSPQLDRIYGVDDSSSLTHQPRFGRDTKKGQLQSRSFTPSERAYIDRLMKTDATKGDIEPIVANYNKDKQSKLSGNYFLNPASSWTTSFHKAFHNFGGGNIYDVMPGETQAAPFVAEWDRIFRKLVKDARAEGESEKTIRENYGATAWDFYAKANTGQSEMLVAQVPIKDIISLPMWGRGTNFESEIVIRSNPDLKLTRLKHMNLLDMRAQSRRLDMHGNMDEIVATVKQDLTGLGDASIDDLVQTEEGTIQLINRLQFYLEKMGYPLEFLPEYLENTAIPRHVMRKTDLPKTELGLLDDALQEGRIDFWSQFAKQYNFPLRPDHLANIKRKDTSSKFEFPTPFEDR